jgi:hypothetical protein
MKKKKRVTTRKTGISKRTSRAERERERRKDQSADLLLRAMGSLGRPRRAARSSREKRSKTSR